MAIDWNLAQRPGGFENALAQGLQFGSQLAERRQQEEQRNALSAYAIDPNNEKNFNMLAMHAPEYALQVRGQRDAAAREAETRRLTMEGAQGNEDAILQLWGVNPDEAARLDTRARARATEGFNFIGQAALDIDRLPEEQRPAAWDAAIDQGVQMGYGGLSQYRGQYSPQSLQGVVARAGQMAPLLSGRDPHYVPLNEGATLVDTRNPQAVQAFGSQGAPQQGMGGGMPSGSPLSQPAPQQAQPQQQSPIFPAGEWQTYSRAIPAPALAAIVERDRPVILNSQGAQVQTDVINGQIAYRVNGVWYDNPEGL